MIRRGLIRGAAGFTLIEVAAVALLLALLAGAVAWSFSGPIAAVRAGDALDRVRTFDAVARHAARQSGRGVTLVLDPADGSMVRQDMTAGEPREAYRAALPGGFKLDRVRTAEDASRSLGGRTVIPCSADGRTQTYAVHIVGGGRDRWLVFAGLTGQPTEVAHEAEVDQIFDTARRSNR